MTTYNTRNPLGSQDPLDLFDNAQNMDHAANSLATEVWRDRFGKSRRTWHGIEKRAEFDIAQAVSIATAEAEGYRDQAKEACDDAKAAAGAIGPIKFYDTLLQAQADIPNLTEGDLVEIAQDSEHDGARTRRRFLAGALAFTVNLDQLRLDLAADDGAGKVAFKAPSAGAVKRSVAQKLVETTSVTDFGAGKGNAAQDALAFQAAANKGGKIIVPAGEFKIETPIYSKSNTTWELHPDAQIYVKTGNGARDHAFVSKGAGLSEKIQLTVDVAKYSDRFSVPNGALFAVGDWILIGDTLARNTIGPLSGEYQCIVAVEGNTLVFGEWIWTDYLVSRGAFVQKCTFAENIHFIGNGRFIGNASGAPSINGPICFEHVSGFSAQGLNIQGFSKNGVYTSAALYGNATQINFKEITDNTQGYGVVVCNGSQWITAERNYSYDASKIWDTGGEAGWNGFNRFLTVRECAAYKAKRGAISTHPQCDFVTIENNDLYAKNNDNGGSTGLATMYLRGANITAVNNRFHGAMRSAIHSQTLGCEGYVDLRNNKIFAPVSHGIVVDSSAGAQARPGQVAPSRISVVDNYVKDAGFYGIYLIIGDTGAVETLRVDLNDVNAAGFACLLDVRAGGGINDFFESENKFKSAGSVVKRVAVAAGQSIARGSSSLNTLIGAAANAVAIQEENVGTNNIVYTDNRLHADQATTGVQASRFGKNRHNGKVISGDSWALQASSFGRVQSTGTIDEVTLATIPLQKRLIGNGGGIKVTATFTMSETTNASKTVRVKLTGVNAGAVATSTTFYENSSVNKTVKAVRVQLEIWNNNNWAAQRGGPIDLGFGNGGSQNTVFGSVDTREPFNVVLTGQLGDPADTVRLESYSVETIYQAT